jgi:Sox developmental protein N terminal
MVNLFWHEQMEQMDVKPATGMPGYKEEKIKETLFVTAASLNNNNNSNLNKNKPNGGRKEDEKITTAVMKVLEGYDWTLVPATTK